MQPNQKNKTTSFRHGADLIKRNRYWQDRPTLRWQFFCQHHYKILFFRHQLQSLRHSRLQTHCLVPRPSLALRYSVTLQHKWVGPVYPECYILICRFVDVGRSRSHVENLVLIFCRRLSLVTNSGHVSQCDRRPPSWLDDQRYPHVFWTAQNHTVYRTLSLDNFINRFGLV